MESNAILLIILTPWGWPFLGYLVFQILAFGLAFWKARWGLLILSILPMPFMVWVLRVTYQAELQGSNLWPIWLILTSPGALFYEILIFKNARETRNP